MIVEIVQDKCVAVSLVVHEWFEAILDEDADVVGKHDGAAWMIL